MSAFHADEWLTVLEGDCRAVLAELPAESVHCVVTSPPYWGLRSYGIGIDKGELGLEQSPEEYVAAMVEVFRAVRRVLRADGTVWLNLGDSYAAGGGFAPDAPSSQARLRGEDVGSLHGASAATYMARSNGAKKAPPGLKPKDLVGIPWRVAFALQADGWYLRSDIIWSKPNPMPESVTDRPTKSHEYVFLLTKSARYFFDADAVREANTRTDEWHEPDPKHVRVTHHLDRDEANLNPIKGQPGWRHLSEPGTGRNLRSVWTIATAPYPGAHFATFPPKLVEPCIKAGTSERGVCPECGAPWERVVEQRDTNGRNLRISTPSAEGFAAGTGHAPMSPSDRVRHLDGKNYVHVRGETTGWRPTCRHASDPVPSVVLDIFAGTGTVGLVAAALSRRAVLIDLNAEYLRQCLERNRQMPLGVA